MEAHCGGNGLVDGGDVDGHLESPWWSSGCEDSCKGDEGAQVTKLLWSYLIKGR